MKGPLASSLGAAVKEARLKRGFTQAELARRAKVSRRHAAALENGANVGALVIIRVAQALGMTEVPLGTAVVASVERAPAAADLVGALSRLDEAELLLREVRTALLP
jgi:transcriptional regulator with XRE-family HTH domain